MHIRRGFIAGTILAIFGSLTVATQAERFWPTLLTVLAFTMTVVIAVTWLITVASRKPSSKT
jgi:hypothetical protein